MGVDCKVILPNNVELEKVASVIGALVGKEKLKQNFTNTEGWYLRVKGVTYRTAPSIPTLVNISVDGPFPDDIKDERLSAGVESIMCYWHWEYEGKGRLLSLRSTPFWIAIAEKLVDFFGGYAIYNDCTDKINYRKPTRTDKENCPQDGKPWQNLQQRIFDVKPLTKADFDKVRKYAVY